MAISSCDEMRNTASTNNRKKYVRFGRCKSPQH